MVFNEKASGKITAAGLLLALALGLVVIPRWSVAQPPPAAEPGVTVAAEEPVATTPPAAPVEVQLTPPAGPAADNVPVPVQPPAVEPPQGIATMNVAGGAEGQVVKIVLADGQILKLRAIEDGTLSVEVERDGKIVEKQMLPFVILRPGDMRATTRAVRRGVGQPQYQYPSAPGIAARPASPAIATTRPAPAAVPTQNYPPQAQPAPQPTIAESTPARVRYRRFPQADADLDLLKVDCELAQVTVEKRKLELDEAKETESRAPGTIPGTKIRLLELGVREAELELKKCQLRLSAESAQEQRQAEPEGARR